ncbi:MAG: hypothetical protein ACYTG6_02275 [Planctomycetota bacterium]|jgi:hypothetical protein
MESQRSASGFNWPHVGLIARFSARFALRTGGGLVFLLVVILAGLSIAAAFISPVETLLQNPELSEDGQVDAGEAIDEIMKSEGVQDVVKWLTGGDDDEAAYLLTGNPALLSAILLFLLMFFPFITCFGASNQTSGDIQSKGLRYLLLRTERPNIFVGRLVGTTLFAAVNTAILMVVLLLYIGFKLQVYDAGPLVSWGLQGFVALIFISLPYIAMCAWISGAIDSPFGALVINLLLTGFPVLFISLASGALKVDGESVMRVLPWGWKYELLASDLPTRLLAMGVMLGFTVLFIFLGLKTFQRRDL